MFILVLKDDIKRNIIDSGSVFDTLEEAQKGALDDEYFGVEVEILEVVTRYKVEMKVELTKVALKNIEQENDNG